MLKYLSTGAFLRTAGRSAIAAAAWSSAFSTTLPPRRDLLGDQRLDVDQLVQVVDPVVAQVVGGDVGDDGDVGLVVAEAAPHDAASGGLEHGGLDVVSSSTISADRGPDASASSTHRPPM